LLLDDSTAPKKIQVKSTGFQGGWFSAVCRDVWNWTKEHVMFKKSQFQTQITYLHVPWSWWYKWYRDKP